MNIILQCSQCHNEVSSEINTEQIMGYCPVCNQQIVLPFLFTTQMTPKQVGEKYASFDRVTRFQWETRSAIRSVMQMVFKRQTADWRHPIARVRRDWGEMRQCKVIEKQISSHFDNLLKDARDFADSL